MRTKIVVFVLATAAFVVGLLLGRPPVVNTVEAQSACQRQYDCVTRCSNEGFQCRESCIRYECPAECSRREEQCRRNCRMSSGCAI
jgi:hypothetical protein